MKPKSKSTVSTVEVSSDKPAAVEPDSDLLVVQRKVPLHEAQSQMQRIEELLGQIETLGTEPEAEALVERKQDEVMAELQMLQQQNEMLYQQAVNRMLNRAAFEMRQWVGRKAVAEYHRDQAKLLNQEGERHLARIASIKAVIAGSLQALGISRIQTAQHKLHLSSSTAVVVDQTKVPGLEQLMMLNDKYPGIISQLKFSDTGRLIDVEFRRTVLKNLLTTGDEETLEDLNFAQLKPGKYLVVPTVSEARAKDQIKVVDTEYGQEVSWVL